MIKENIEITGSVDVANDIKNKVQTTGVRGLDIEKAQELGVFQRIANLLCAMHASIMASHRIYGGVDYLIDQLQARKNEIAFEMNKFDKAFDRFVNFWTGYYAHGKSGAEVNFETENLYHKIMEWMEMPETWELGGEQRTEAKGVASIRVNMPNDRVFTLHKACMNEETLESKESWCVLCYDPNTNKQTSVNTDMDKSSAMMVAKRLSDENKDCIYTAALIRDVVEKRTEVLPFKAYINNETVGKLIK